MSEVRTYQQVMCRFGNKGGSRKTPKYKHSVSVQLNAEDYAYLMKMKRMGAGSLSEEVRRCVEHCRKHDALPVHPRLWTADSV